LHRPDYLMEPAEVAAAFDRLHQSGKVREIGVSNFAPSQVVALQRACSRPLVVNQVEVSLARLTALEDGTLDQCLAEKITPMAWSPLAGGKLGDRPGRLLPSQEAYRTEAINRELDQLAAAHGTSRIAVALAWLLRHPARIVPVIGSIDPARIKDATQADELQLSREEWYRLLTIARSSPLP
jgi:predicted oxidoreductase